ncbi:hypothetical protein J31TS4_36640 [Paenibacillus sp. J31TS4]|uniref:DUF4129 domain-containing protein n=1 Tax=Paenibacillus sp. J31TS4 TaxID=2807195 RepID=UPI001B1D2AD5|nr:DUF4129 domain-containing protein [Paenibacillus sp. J31TS4]GIP40384.1 hypothetical protein J31TS4_36640 [Paenibacillus sp. J31TS4]
MARLRRTLFTWLHGGMEILIFLPILLAVGVAVAPSGQALLWTVLLSLFYLAGAAGWQLLRIRRRVLRLLYVAAAAIAVAWLLPAGPLGLWGAVPVGAVLVYRGLQMAERTLVTMYPEMVYWIGPFLYWAGSLFYRNVTLLKVYETAYGRLGLLTLVLVFVLTNRVHLQWTASSANRNQERGKTARLAPGMLRHNRVLLGALLVLIVLFSQWRGLLHALQALYGGVLMLVARLLALLPQAEERPPETQRPPDQMPPFDMEPSEPSRFLVLLEMVAKVAVMLALAAGVVLLLIVLFKRLRQLIRWLRENRMGMSGEETAGEGYVDEEESLEGWKQIGGRSADRVRAWLSRFGRREPKWEELASGQERARYLYRQLLRRRSEEGEAAKPGLTPAETTGEWAARHPERTAPLGELAKAYNEARYGEREPRQADLDRTRRELGLD